MAGAQRCTRCGEREVWAAVVNVPTLRDHKGSLSVGTPAERLCKECYHSEQRVLAAEDRRRQREHLASIQPNDLSEIVQHLAVAVRTASNEEWSTIVAGLREAEQLRGSPWPPEIRRYLRNEARDDRESSA